jgi:endo-1,4-beta-xylanase
MKQHIIDIMTRYKGRVNTWVVVNEAHWDNEWDFWRKKIGNDYIEIAFQTAREVDPSAKLLYSDFQNETLYSKKTNFNKQVVKTLLEKGLIDGIGLHMRINASTPPKKEDLIKTFQSYGVPIYITELDIDLSNVKGSSEERFLKQAEIMKIISSAAKESGVCNYFIMFGIGDKYSWLEEDKGKINADATAFTDDLSPKPSYYAMMQGLFP